MTDVSRETKALLPCPFCGSPAELERDSDHHGEWFNLGCSRHWGRVKDPDKSCLGARLWYTETDVPEVEAIAAWNRRAGYSAALPLTDAEKRDLCDVLDKAMTGRVFTEMTLVNAMFARLVQLRTGRSEGTP
jgi:hypothetical protein